MQYTYGNIDFVKKYNTNNKYIIKITILIYSIIFSNNIVDNNNIILIKTFLPFFEQSFIIIQSLSFLLGWNP